jgi:hypothetical protein
MNTYLLYCRFQKMRGGLTEKEYDQEIASSRTALGNLAPTEAALAGVPGRLGLRQSGHDPRD